MARVERRNPLGVYRAMNPERIAVWRNLVKPANWSYLCDVDIAPLAAWLAEGDKAWPAPSTPRKPQRVREIPAELLEPIYSSVLTFFRQKLECDVCGNWPNEDGEIEHGKGCYTQSADGGGSSFVANYIAIDPMLSRMLPGQSHDFHVDIQRADWITRVHVPIVTNPGCWMAWENAEKKAYWLEHYDTLPNVRDIAEVVHFEAGRAYSFNTLERHSFGNDGETERVHLIFEVLRRD